MSQATPRSFIDCRDFPSESVCSLRISGTRDEVLMVAAHHAITSHGHSDSPDLRRELAQAIAFEAVS
jgi:hypothetical protein